MTFFRQVPILQGVSEGCPSFEPRSHSPSQHVALLSFFEDQHQLVDTVDLILDALDQRAERIGNVVDEGVGDPVGGDGDVVFEMLDSSSDILRMRRAPEVELRQVSVAQSCECGLDSPTGCPRGRR